MANLRFERPEELTDDDVWFKFFRKRNLKVIVVCLVVTFLLRIMFGLFGYSTTGTVIGIVLTIIVTGITLVPMENDYMNGGSLTLDVFIIRRYIRRKTATAYIKGYGKMQRR